jgi:hypothetical protein
VLHHLDLFRRTDALQVDPSDALQANLHFLLTVQGLLGKNQDFGRMVGQANVHADPELLIVLVATRNVDVRLDRHAHVTHELVIQTDVANTRWCCTRCLGSSPHTP